MAIHSIREFNFDGATDSFEAVVNIVMPNPRPFTVAMPQLQLSPAMKEAAKPLVDLMLEEIKSLFRDFETE